MALEEESSAAGMGWWEEGVGAWGPAEEALERWRDRPLWGKAGGEARGKFVDMWEVAGVRVAPGDRDSWCGRQRAALEAS